VASFLISASPDPLFSCKSVASFFKKINFSFQPSAFSFQPLVRRRLPPTRSNPTTTTALCLLLSAFQPGNGGFVPDFSTTRPFVFMQIGGFVFEKIVSFQPQPRQVALPPTPSAFHLSKALNRQISAGRHPNPSFLLKLSLRAPSDPNLSSFSSVFVSKVPQAIENRK
jgi:hypothetical protein